MPVCLLLQQRSAVEEVVDNADWSGLSEALAHSTQLISEGLYIGSYKCKVIMMVIIITNI